MRRVMVVITSLAVAAFGLAAMPHTAVAVTTGSRFVALSPFRVLDTRNGPGPIGLVPANGTIVADLAPAGVPTGATAVALNLTIDAASAPGYVTAYAQGSVRPVASSVNVSAKGQTASNFVIVALGATPAVSLYDLGGSHLIVDVSGYWLASGGATAGRFVPSSPHRILDTRAGNSLPYLAAGTTVDVDVVVLAGLPADASAVAATVTGVNAQGPGFVTAWPTGQARPNSSIVNLSVAGAVVPNLVIVPVGAGGKVSLFTANGAHLLLDVVGYMTGDSAASSTDGLFVPVSPTRVIDTRDGTGGIDRLAADLYDEAPIAGSSVVPASGVGAVVANITVTDPFGSGFLTSFPGATVRPNASMLNFSRGQTVAGLAMVQLGANGTVGLYSPTGAEAIVDVAGWFTGAAAADGGVKPRRCRNLMGFQHAVTGADFDDIVVRDMSGATPDATVASGSVGVRFAANCEYMIVALPNPTVADTFDLFRYNSVNGGGQPKEIVTAMSWHGMGLSRDSRYLYFYGGTVHGAGGTGSDAVSVYDAVTGGTSVAFRTALPEVLDNIGGVFKDGRVAFSAFTASTEPSQLYVASATAAPTLMYGTVPGDFISEAVSPDEATLAVIRVNPAVGATPPTPDAAFIAAPPTPPSFTLSNVYPIALHPRFTWTGDRVVDLGPTTFDPQPRPRIVRQQGGPTGSYVTLLNGDTDTEPEFAYSYALAPTLVS